MSHLEEELRKVLHRKEPPQGFVDRVSARIDASQKLVRARRLNWWVSLFRLPRIAWVAGAVLTCLTVTLGITEYRAYKKTRAEGAIVKTQLILALKIAGKKLNLAQSKILEMNNRGAPTQGSRDQ